uniref:Uncharacterized protein n=1 Tax=Populus trichocarpa TaxID=3694 RepID=U5FNP8_POPTR
MQLVCSEHEIMPTQYAFLALTWFYKLQEMHQILKEQHPSPVSQIYHRVHLSLSSRIRALPRFINTCLQ